MYKIDKLIYIIQLIFIILNVEPNVLAIVFSVCIRKYNIAIDNL